MVNLGWDAAFKALADPTRRAILRLLYDRDLAAGEIARLVGMSAPALSHHLTALKSADLVEAQRDGQTIVYSLNTSAMQDVLRYLLDSFSGGQINE